VISRKKTGNFPAMRKPPRASQALLCVHLSDGIPCFLRPKRIPLRQFFSFSQFVRCLPVVCQGSFNAQKNSEFSHFHMITSKAQINVRYAETDQMGVAYHGNYLAWFEVGRTKLFKEQGLPYKKMEADGYLFPVLEIAVKYRRPALYDDDLTIVTTLKDNPALRFTLYYEVWRGDTLLATGSTMHAFIDREGRPVRPPPYVVARLNELFGRKNASSNPASAGTPPPLPVSVLPPSPKIAPPPLPVSGSRPVAQQPPLPPPVSIPPPLPEKADVVSSSAQSQTPSQTQQLSEKSAQPAPLKICSTSPVVEPESEPCDIILRLLCSICHSPEIKRKITGTGDVDRKLSLTGGALGGALFGWAGAAAGALLLGKTHHNLELGVQYCCAECGYKSDSYIVGTNTGEWFYPDSDELRKFIKNARVSAKSIKLKSDLDMMDDL
jgi:acyl-CoA thioester hydrolase